LDFQQNAVNILHVIVVPEPDNATAFANKKCRPPLISGVVGMLPAVKLDDEPQLVAGEVAKVRTDGRLPSEVMHLERLLTKVMPEQLLHFGRVAT
jgi:hypothetical protein